MATENTLQALLAPALFWLGGTRECHEGLSEKPTDVELHLCTNAGGAVVRIPMPQSSLPYWPKSLELTAASLGRPGLVTNSSQPLFKLVRLDSSAAVTYKLEVPHGEGWMALPSVALLRGQTLAFSIAYGTDFLVPSPALKEDILYANPLCIDREHRRLTSASAASETLLDKFLTTMSEVLMPFENEKTPLISLALCPECMDDPMTAQAVSEVRSILHSLFVPAMSDLRLGAVVVRAVSARGTPDVTPSRRAGRRSPIMTSSQGWLGELREFESEAIEFQKELTRPMRPNTQDPALHVVKRVSLLVHLASMLASAEGARLLCAWPPLAQPPQEIPIPAAQHMPLPLRSRVPLPPRREIYNLSAAQMNLFRGPPARRGP